LQKYSKHALGTRYE